MHNVDAVWLVSRRNRVPSGNLTDAASLKPYSVNGKQSRNDHEGDDENVLNLHRRRCAVLYQIVNAPDEIWLPRLLLTKMILQNQEQRRLKRSDARLPLIGYGQPALS